MPARDSPYRGAWPRVRRAVLARDGHRCHICGLPGADNVDHLDPVATHAPAVPPADRLAAAHVACNTRRRHEIEQAERAGRQPDDLARSG